MCASLYSGPAAKTPHVLDTGSSIYIGGERHLMSGDYACMEKHGET